MKCRHVAFCVATPRLCNQLSNKCLVNAARRQQQKAESDLRAQIALTGCFVAGTPVHTKEGLRPIEQIKVGDYVLSKPEDGKGKTAYKPVVKIFEF
jgi:hypothetical protein